MRAPEWVPGDALPVADSREYVDVSVRDHERLLEGGDGL